jgi:hypothetical protein
MRILGILVVYDESRAEASITSFRQDIHALSDINTILVVANSKIDSLGLRGSNRCGEFSGWDEGLQAISLHGYDIIVFANDTYWLNDRFNASSRQLFRHALKKANPSRFMLGEVSWQIYWHNLLQLKPFQLRWVRTSIFALSRDALQQLERVGVGEIQLSSLILNSGPRRHFCGDFPPLMLERINKWLFPLNPEEGWHSAQTSDDARLLLKAKCVLQELQLSERCNDAGVSLVNYKSKGRYREALLSSLYYFSCWLSRKKSAPGSLRVI